MDTGFGWPDGNYIYKANTNSIGTSIVWLTVVMNDDDYMYSNSNLYFISVNLLECVLSQMSLSDWLRYLHSSLL